MAQQLSALQKAALDFMIEAKKVDECFLAVCLNEAAPVHVNNDDGVAMAVTAVAQHVAQVGQIQGDATEATAFDAHNWANVFNAMQQGGDCMNHQTFVGVDVGTAAAGVANAAAVGGSESTEAVKSTAPKGASLEDLIKLRHGLR